MFNTYVQCQKCSGRGRMSAPYGWYNYCNSEDLTCSVCNGHGKLRNESSWERSSRLREERAKDRAQKREDDKRSRQRDKEYRAKAKRLQIEAEKRRKEQYKEEKLKAKIDEASRKKKKREDLKRTANYKRIAQKEAVLQKYKKQSEFERIESKFWVKQKNESAFLAFILFPFRLLFRVVLFLINSIMMLIKFPIALIGFILCGSLNMLFIIPLRLFIYLITFGTVSCFQYWFIHQTGKLKLWFNGGYLST